MPNEVKLILASTFRHFFLSVGLAMKDKKNVYSLVFIDQKDDQGPVFMAAQKLGAPFYSVSCLPSRRDGESKHFARRRALKALKGILENQSPVEVITGNDRRVEFQYAMNLLRKHSSKSVLGSFIDDGTGSYVSFYNTSLLKRVTDRFVDSPLKKIAYGRWYEIPVVFGASDWIDACYLTIPKSVPAELKEKTIIELPSDWYVSAEAKKYFKSLYKQLSLASLEGGQCRTVLFVLPHSSAIADMYGSTHNFRRLIKSFAAKYENIFFKYHPRDNDDPYGLAEWGVLLKSEIPAELYLVLYEYDVVIGDISTALMSAKWINPNCSVHYIPTKSNFSKVVIPLFNELGVTSLNS